jgi:wobble nucleotide-excising tRNase
MIKKIDYIKDFGIYKNFTWNDKDLKDFNFKNLLYGWNYSGKTTLSRIFSSLRDRKLHDGYAKGIFKIKTNDGDFDSSNLENFPYDLLVFNSDYIKDNLNFSIHKDAISDSKTILFEVGDNAKFEKKINELRAQIESINGSEIVKGKKFIFLKSIEEFERYDKGTTGDFTILARKIQNEDFLSLIGFTKTQLKPVLNIVKKDLDLYIIKDKKQLLSLSEIVKTSEPKAELDEIEIYLTYPKIIEKTNQLLNKTPEKSTINKILENNPAAYTWVKEGQNFHQSNDKCLFCDNVVKEDRIEFLKKYFNSEASVLKENVSSLKYLITQEEQNIKMINIPSSINDFNLGFINDFKTLKKQFDKALLSYKKHLKYLILSIDNKINKSLYSSVGNADKFNIEELEKAVERLNELIKKNNNFSKNFNSEINSKRDEFIKHLVASFLKREKYLSKEKKYYRAILEIEKLNLKIKKNEEEISWNESRKASDSEGALQYTCFIQSFLSRTDIEIILDDKTKKFVLLRNKENASNLSEGEKTAIAFSHFLVTNNSLELANKFKDFIVFVDDPISSLDGNHIFQINSLLKETFFHQIPDPKNPKQNMWRIKCKQLFISTHNFDFFNLMKELPKSLNGYDYIKDEKRCKESRYFIERKISESSIISIPSIFDDFKSEYHYLFSEITKFNNDLNKATFDKLLMMPNVLRRFVEVYTLTKYPSRDEVDERANIVFGKLKSKRILKPLNYFSHSNNIDYIGKHNELIADLPAACSTLIDFIKTEDKNHFAALEKAIN